MTFECFEVYSSQLTRLYSHCGWQCELFTFWSCGEQLYHLWGIQGSEPCMVIRLQAGWSRAWFPVGLRNFSRGGSSISAVALQPYQKFWEKLNSVS